MSCFEVVEMFKMWKHKQLRGDWRIRRGSETVGSWAQKRSVEGTVMYLISCSESSLGPQALSSYFSLPPSIPSLTLSHSSLPLVATTPSKINNRPHRSHHIPQPAFPSAPPRYPPHSLHLQIQPSHHNNDPNNFPRKNPTLCPIHETAIQCTSYTRVSCALVGGSMNTVTYTSQPPSLRVSERSRVQESLRVWKLIQHCMDPRWWGVEEAQTVQSLICRSQRCDCDGCTSTCTNRLVALAIQAHRICLFHDNWPRHKCQQCQRHVDTSNGNSCRLYSIDLIFMKKMGVVSIVRKYFALEACTVSRIWEVGRSVDDRCLSCALNLRWCIPEECHIYPFETN